MKGIFYSDRDVVLMVRFAKLLHPEMVFASIDDVCQNLNLQPAGRSFKFSDDPQSAEAR